ncbi:MAG: ferrous iron transporter B [Coriobacteriia bacterium]|nr:ferrous iron transporter B [Coriobacteriia bacterium]
MSGTLPDDRRPEAGTSGESVHRVLLVGNPNVGKSVVFSRLTGIGTMSSNYPGTTVEFLEGAMQLAGERVPVIDVPGSYSLEPTCPAEDVACRILDEGGIVVDVVDATNLERNLALTLQLRQRGLRMIVALNLWDETRHRGIHIDVDALSRKLGVPVIPTSAIAGMGMKELVDTIEQVAEADPPQALPPGDVWCAIGAIVTDVQHIEHRHHTWRDVLEEVSVRPVTGIPFGILVLFTAFVSVRFIGETIIALVMEPLFETLWRPVVTALSEALGKTGLIHGLLVGNYVVIDGVRTIDFVQSFGLLTTGLFVIFGMVMPYIMAFYFVLGLMEDIGYLPRLAVLLDRMMHRLGLHGYAVIPLLLGFGCNVPGILATRVLDTRRERFIAATLISVGVPCAAMQAMIFALLGPFGVRYILLVYAILMVVWFVLGTFLRVMSKDFLPEIILEIPPYRRPALGTLWKKLAMRLRGFFREAVPIVLLGVLVVDLIYMSGAFKIIAQVFGPLMDSLFGLPPETALALALGFLRKDVAVGMLAPLGLPPLDLVKASVLLALTFPCIATYTVMLRELGWHDTLKATGLMIVIAITTGVVMNIAF